jgi:hypothetical protein
MGKKGVGSDGGKRWVVMLVVMYEKCISSALIWRSRSKGSRESSDKKIKKPIIGG